MIKRKTHKLILFVFLLFGIVSCDSSGIYEENFEVDSDGWHADDIKAFTFTLEDTISPLNFWINFRTSTDYPYSNLFMFLYSEYPDGYSAKDTLQFILAAPNGEWQGESSGTVVENRFLVSQGPLKKPGQYTFKLQQAMRDEILPEVLDVGFRVELMELNE